MKKGKKPHFSKTGIGYIPKSGFAWLLLFGTAALAICLSYLVDFLGSSLNTELVHFIRFMALATVAIGIWLYARNHSD